jgi:cobyrinic acid a,c-diamide synthase
MRYLPRLAVGTIQPTAHRESVTWALLAALQALDDSPVLFRSSCAFAAHDPSKTVLGRAARHLDSWAMSRCDAVCALAAATGERETAIIEGAFDAALPAMTVLSPRSSLDTLCTWLDLPRVAIIDVTELPIRRLTVHEGQFDAILLDRVADLRDAAYWQTTLEALWKTPVLGWLDEAAPLRALAASLREGSNPSRELCHALAQRLLPTLRIDRLRWLAHRALPLVIESDVWLGAASEDRFRIAIAYDQAYCGYYPETLDLLESAGAELCDFSPLRSESLPDGADVVYFGCGHPERDPEALARNHCLKQSLRCFAAAGGRIYAEGSGLAYLCRDMVFPCGRTVPMTGLLPATARLHVPSSPPEPTEVTFGASSWLMPADVSFRGYRHTGWEIEPRGSMISYASHPGQRLDVLGRGNVIGSRVLVNLAANRHLLRRFFEPYLPVASAGRQRE